MVKKNFNKVTAGLSNGVKKVNSNINELLKVGNSLIINNSLLDLLQNKFTIGDKLINKSFIGKKILISENIDGNMVLNIRLNDGINHQINIYNYKIENLENKPEFVLGDLKPFYRIIDGDGGNLMESYRFNTINDAKERIKDFLENEHDRDSIDDELIFSVANFSIEPIAREQLTLKETIINDILLDKDFDFYVNALLKNGVELKNKNQLKELLYKKTEREIITDFYLGEVEKTEKYFLKKNFCDFLGIEIDSEKPITISYFSKDLGKSITIDTTINSLITDSELDNNLNIYTRGLFYIVDHGNKTTIEYNDIISIEQNINGTINRVTIK